MKVCKTCGECKPPAMFYKRDGTPDGYDVHCKKCKSERANARYRERRESGWTRSRDVGHVEPVWPVPNHSDREQRDAKRLRKWRGPVNHEPMRCRL